MKNKFALTPALSPTERETISSTLLATTDQ